MSPGYTPISCDFHDWLEALATSGRPARVEFRGVDGAVAGRTAILKDVFSRDGAEYLVMDGGETVRLDHLVAVEGVQLPKTLSGE